ncbi:MAG: alpha amylase N-terminal ig-like domain-containing protein, partial [Ardenticatenales bacterium]|nr:alpha amylase N-terminal ig-like domain-containing protein [Ardenticatenales bacterium]
ADWVGVAWTDMSRLHAWADDQNIYLFINSPAYDPAVSSGQLGLAIDTGPGGGNFDPWGNAISYDYQFTNQNLGSTPTAAANLPDYIIRGNVFGPDAFGAENGWTELRGWNGSNFDTGSGADWGGIGNSGQPSLPGSKVAWSAGEGLRLTIPFSDINVAAGDTINLQFFGTQSGGGKGAYDTVPSDDQSTGWDDPTTQNYLSSLTLPGGEPPVGDGCQSGAAIDNNVFWNELGHNSRDGLFRTPGGPVTTGTAVTLRLRSACDDLTGVSLRVWDDRVNAQQILPLTKAASDNLYDYWEVTLPAAANTTLYWYRFIVTDGATTVYYEDDGARDMGWGQVFADSPDNSYQLTVYDPAFTTPDWVKNAVIYQIFPDRFRDGDSGNNPPAGRFFYNELDGTIVRSNSSDWNSAVCDPRDATDCPGTYSLNFYGGDLQGVADELDYLQSLGVTAIYFNPIFASPSNHKYDTADYSVISADFGDLAVFQALIDEAHSRGMHVILDGVFNHTSSDSSYFDRYSRFDAAGNETSAGIGTNDGSGACESPASPYRDWYYFTDVAPGTGTCAGSDGSPNGAVYESWFGFDSLPKLNAQNPDVRAYIWDSTDSIVQFWLGQGVDGWRFDVGGDVDPGLTNDPNNDYWEGFRAAAHATNPDTYLVLEEWGNASPWLLGDEMDATMNYQYSSAMLSFWRDTTFVDNDHNAGSSAGVLAPLTPSQFDARIQNWIERYPPEALYAMMNLLGSHDTNRALFMLDHNATAGTDDTPLRDPNYDWSDAMTRLQGVVLLQMTLPGAPTIYYGDEVGLVGPVYYHGGNWEDDPYNRQPYPWADESGTPFYSHLQAGGAGHTDLLPYYQALTAARNAHPALRTGSFDSLLIDDSANVYVYGRLMADYSDAAVVIVNRAAGAQSVTVDVNGYLPAGASFSDVLNGGSYTVDGSGQITVPTVPGMSGALLVADAALSAPPAAVSDLVVSSANSDSVSLSWSAAPGASSYDVYRSPLSGGGYSLIGNTAATSYSDTGLDVATTYYYIVVSRADATLLVGGSSNEVAATPAYSIGWANLQWPPALNHTISAVNRTENVYGQIWIDGVTSIPGATPGLLAQVGYGPVGTTASDSWSWAPLAFNADTGNNDEYAGSLLPTALGTYCYTTRYSGDGGASWFYAVNGPDEGNATCPGPYGVLTVLPSADTTAPATPTGLAVTGSSPSDVSLSWDAHPNTDGDLVGFELYRENTAAPGYSLIAAISDPAATSYVDTAVTPGANYNYYLVAFDTSFNRSGASDVVNATAEPRMVTVTFRVGVPAYTPGTVFIVGDLDAFGPWNPGLVPMTQADATTWSYTLDILDGTTLQFKFTRGSWDTVESWGSIVNINNRSVNISYGSDGTQLVDLTATDWGAGSDSTKAVQYWRDPLVTAVSPADGSTSVPLTSPVTVSWSIPMAPDTDFVVSGPAGTVPGSFAYDAAGQTVTFTPAAPLEPGTTYDVTIAGASSVGVPGGDSGVQQVGVTTQFTTISIEAQMADLFYEIGDRIADGTLNPLAGALLQQKLLFSYFALQINRPDKAILYLEAFIYKVEKYEWHGLLSPDLAADWTARAQSLIDQIRAE